jgi:hypothetical protein
MNENINFICWYIYIYLLFVAAGALVVMITKKLIEKNKICILLKLKQTTTATNSNCPFQ